MKTVPKTLSRHEAQLITRDRGKLKCLYQEIGTSIAIKDLCKMIAKEFGKNNVSVLILFDARK